MKDQPTGNQEITLKCFLNYYNILYHPNQKILLSSYSQMESNRLLREDTLSKEKETIFFMCDSLSKVCIDLAQITIQGVPLSE